VTLFFEQFKEIDRLVDEIDYGEEVDDIPLCYRTKSMFLPTVLKRKLNDNLKEKMKRIENSYTLS
jgi:hypothetical protein